MKIKIALLGLAFAALFALGRAADAQLNTPTAGDGSSLPPSEAPCVPYIISSSTPVGGNQTVRTSGPGYLAQVVLSTGLATGYVILRDTSTVTTSAGPLAQLSYITANSQVFTFSPPLRFTNGLTAQVIGGADITNSVTLCTRLYGTQTP